MTQATSIGEATESAGGNGGSLNRSSPRSARASPAFTARAEFLDNDLFLKLMIGGDIRQRPQIVLREHPATAAPAVVLVDQYEVRSFP